MSTECIGGRERRLVDARFLGPLSAKERGRLEAHLAACSFCGERYRRLQLADRVASVGAARALEAPSAFEIERVAADLGLLEPPRRSFWATFPWRMTGLATFAGAAVMIALLALVIPREDAPVERSGAESAVSVSAYLIGPNLDVRPHDPKTPVHRGDHLKLTVSLGADIDPHEVAMLTVLLVQNDVILASDIALRSSDVPPTFPAISLERLRDGPCSAYVIASAEAIDGYLSKRVIRGRPAGDEVARTLGKAVISVERIDFEVEPDVAGEPVR